MLNIEVLVADGTVVDIEVIGTEVEEVIEAVKKLNKELCPVTSEQSLKDFNKELGHDVCKGRWVEAEG